MANKKVKYTFGGANQDVSKSKHSPQFYFEGQHIRISATDTQSTGGVTNEKGTELIISLPSITIISTVDITDPTSAVIANDDILSLSVIYGTRDITVLSNDFYLNDVTITIIQQPSFGTVEILSDNKLRYTDTSGDGDTIDNFIYQIDDGTTQDTATVTTNIRVGTIGEPDNEDGDNIDILFNYDGTFFYYMFAPCDTSSPFFVGRSNRKITDDKIYGFTSGTVTLGSGKLGKMAYRIEPQSTTWATDGVAWYDNCRDDGDGTGDGDRINIQEQ